MLFIGELHVCACVCVCVWKHAEGTSIIIFLWISTEGVECRGDEERLPSALLPLGVKQHALLRTYITQQIKNGLWGWSRPPQQPPPAPPNNTTCATTAEHSSQLYAWSCYSFITSRRPLTQGPDVWGFFFPPTVIWHWVFLIFCAPSLHPTFPLCLVRAGAHKACRQNAEL